MHANKTNDNAHLSDVLVRRARTSAREWTWGYCSAVTRDGWRWIVDAHREARRYIIHSDELLSAFLELEATLRSDIYCRQISAVCSKCCLKQD